MIYIIILIGSHFKLSMTTFHPCPSILVLVGLLIWEKANPGATYFCAVWTCESWWVEAEIFGGGFLLPVFALVCCGMVEVAVKQCSAFTDQSSPVLPVGCYFFPIPKVNKVLLMFVLMLSLYLFFWPPGAHFTKPNWELSTWEAAIWHTDDMTCPSKLVLGYDGSDGGDVSFFQDCWCWYAGPPS